MSLDIDKIRRSVGIIGESDSIHEMLATIGQVANTDILVTDVPLECNKGFFDRLGPGVEWMTRGRTFFGIRVGSKPPKGT